MLLGLVICHHLVSRILGLGDGRECRYMRHMRRERGSSVDLRGDSGQPIFKAVYSSKTCKKKKKKKK